MKPRVLVAERSPTLQRLITVTLGGEEVTSACFGDGASALADLRSELPALLIVDASLPGVDGYELAAALRESDGGEAVPILLVLTDHESPNLERMTRLGIHDVLTKPFEQHDLRERVRGLLGLQTPPAAARVDDGAPYTRPLPAAKTQRSTDTPLGLEGDELDLAVDRAVEERIHAVVQRALVDVLGSIAEAPLREAIDEAIADALPGVLAESTFDLGQEARAALQAAARAAIEERFEDGGAELLGPLVEPIVWKVVPELAEQHIEDEIRRLTAAEDTEEDPEK